MKTATGKTRLQTQAIIALLESRTIKEAAARCGITSRTLLNWKATSEFDAEDESAKRDYRESAINRLRMGGFDAADRLHEVVIDPDAPLAVVVSASWRLLDLLLKAGEIENLAQRLDRLEASLKDGDQ